MRGGHSRVMNEWWQGGGDVAKAKWMANGRLAGGKLMASG